jgi:hypothetical protein
MREVSVRDEEIRITGSKAVLARAAAQGLYKMPPGVLSFVREWRTRQCEGENTYVIVAAL